MHLGKQVYMPYHIDLQMIAQIHIRYNVLTNCVSIRHIRVRLH